MFDVLVKTQKLSVETEPASPTITILSADGTGKSKHSFITDDRIYTVN